MAKRKWTKEEKLKIIKESESEGVTVTIRKHGIYANTLYGWKEKLALGGEQALAPTRLLIDPEIKRLKQENLMLKELVAEKELALRIKEELLKKSVPQKSIK